MAQEHTQVAASLQTPPRGKSSPAPKDSCLKVGIRFLGVVGDALPPQTECLPMDQRDDFQRDQRILDREVKEASQCEFAAGSGERADESFFGDLVVVDEDAEVLARKIEPEIEFQIES